MYGIYEKKNCSCDENRRDLFWYGKFRQRNSCIASDTRNKMKVKIDEGNCSMVFLLFYGQTSKLSPCFNSMLYAYRNWNGDFQFENMLDSLVSRIICLLQCKVMCWKSIIFFCVFFRFAVIYSVAVDFEWKTKKKKQTNKNLFARNTSNLIKFTERTEFVSRSADDDDNEHEHSVTYKCQWWAMIVYCAKKTRCIALIRMHWKLLCSIFFSLNVSFLLKELLLLFTNQILITTLADLMYGIIGLWFLLECHSMMMNSVSFGISYRRHTRTREITPYHVWRRRSKNVMQP